MSRTALVTGAHGFIGRHVARLLSDSGYTVTGIGHGAWAARDADAAGLTFWHTADVTLDALVTYAGEPSMIIHCAGSGSVPFSMQQPHQDFVRTVANTAAVLEYVRLHSPGSLVVYPSSGAVYGATTKIPIEETDPLRPASPYGVHKLMAEELCRSYATHFATPVAIVRFFSIYGSGLRKQLLWDACHKVASGDATFHGTGLEVRDWVHVSDAAALLVAAAGIASAQCPVVNGGSGVGTEVSRVLELVYGRLRPGERPVFNGVGRAGDPSRFVADRRRANDIGWTPTVELERGIGDYVSWFQGLRT